MLKKQPLLIVTFHTTSESMAFEKAAAAAGIPGKLGPVPRSLGSDCGIAFRAEPAQEAAVRALLEAQALEIDRVCVVET